MRIDVFLVENNFAQSRNKAKQLIEEKRVFCDGKLVEKSSFEVCDNNITVKPSEKEEFVGRGGLKLLHALNEFNISVTNLAAADIGASTGGFTDCLLQKGAKKVYAIDSGQGQLHQKLLCDKRVISIESFNARFLTEDTIGEKVDIVVMDVSFISQTMLYEAVTKILKENGIFIPLIKPQFEVGKENLNKNGIVKNDKARKSAVTKIIKSASQFSFENIGVIDSPIEGGSGNKEFLAYFLYKK